MLDREKVIKGLECLITNEIPCDNCQYNIKDNSCLSSIAKDAIALLKEQETHDTRDYRIFQCEKCGYGIEDIFLNNEHDYPILPVYCPNCGRLVKRE